jgi:vitamin B12 transport system substrate-binding protein
LSFIKEYSPLRVAILIIVCLFSPFTLSVERIVSLAPSSTELIYASGLGDKLIAVSAYSNYPKEAQSLEKVASFDSVNIERIVELNPDLIVAWHSGGSAKYLKQLEGLGFNIHYSDATQLLEIASRIEELSQYADDPQIGLNNAKRFRTKLKQLNEENANKVPITYFYQLSSKPIYTIANNQWPSEVFSVCGGINIFEESPIAYPQVGLEQVIVKGPDVLFTSPHTIQNTDMWMQWQEQIPAVANQQVWSVNADWLNRPTPRSLLAVEQVCELLDKARKKNNAKD